MLDKKTKKIIPETKYEIMEIREKEAIVYDGTTGRSYVCPCEKTEKGKYIIRIKNIVYLV